MANLKNIETAFTQAVESKKMPGIVAAAVTDKGTLYEGAFGTREIGKNAPMTVDTIVWIASMTKAITGTAAMQLVEKGKLSLDAPASSVVPDLAQAKVLEGWDGDKPRLRAPKRPMTLKHLLTHTSGYSYEIWRPDIARYQQATNTPGITTCTNAALTTPLLFDPGDQWDYGIGIDWTGKMVEAASGQKLDAYFQQHIFGPLGMKDTGFKLSAAQKARASAVHQRDDKGALAPVEFGLPENPEFLMGGGGLYGTASDYLAFAQMIMNGGTHKGAQVLRRETVDLMSQSHIGALEIPAMKTAIPPLSNDVELMPGIGKKWGLSSSSTRSPCPPVAPPAAWPGPGWPTRTSGSIAPRKFAACSCHSCCRSTTTPQSICSGSSRRRSTRRSRGRARSAGSSALEPADRPPASTSRGTSQLRRIP
jgi:CubicO group peptidase (beta-lactamase class C family)